MRILAAFMATAACIGSAAACAHAQSDGPHTMTASGSAELCALTSVQTRAGRELVAEAASGLSGSWRLQLGGPALSLQQSGDLSAGRDALQPLARIQLDAPAAAPVSLDDLQPGQTVMSGASGPLFGALTVIDDEGRILCSAEWEGV